MADIQKTKFTNLNGDNLIVLPDTDEANNGDVLTFTNDEGTSALKWAAGGGGGGGSTGEYVPLSAERCTIGAGNEVNTSTSYFALAQGSANSAQEDAFAQGNSNYATSKSIAQGKNNRALYTSFAQGESNYANNYCFTQGNNVTVTNTAMAQGLTVTAHSASFAQGTTANATEYSLAQGYQIAAESASFAQGYQNAARTASFAQGQQNSAIFYSIAQGHENTATNNAQAFGNGVIISAGMAIGKYNKTSANAAFVIGNGTDNTDRSDLFIIKNDGTVSGTGNIYASGGQVVTDVMLTSATNSTTSFVTNGVADLTPLYTYIKSLEDRIAALEAAQGGDGFTVNGVQPTVNGNTITVGE